MRQEIYAAIVYIVAFGIGSFAAGMWFAIARVGDTAECQLGNPTNECGVVAASTVDTASKVVILCGIAMLITAFVAYIMWKLERGDFGDE